MMKITEQEYLSNQIDNMRQVFAHLLRAKDKTSFSYVLKNNLPDCLRTATKYSMYFLSVMVVIGIVIISVYGIAFLLGDKDAGNQLANIINDYLMVYLYITIGVILVIFISNFMLMIGTYIEVNEARRQFSQLESHEVLPYSIMLMHKEERFYNDRLALYFDVNLVTSDLMNTHLTDQYLEDFYSFIAEEAKTYSSPYHAQQNMKYIMLVAFIEVFIKARNLQEYRKLNQSINKLKNTTN